MSKPLTTTQKKKYLKADQHCPYCNNEDIEGGPIDIDYKTAWQKITCNKCSREWYDIYKLVDIEEI
jgi:transcription elongation factor Elf1